MPKLVIQSGTSQARDFKLKPGSNYLGRGSGNDFQIEDQSVSGSHAQVFVDGDLIVVKDLGSTNGTYINHSQVKEGFLQPGQALRLGAVEMVFEADAPANAPTTAGVVSPPVPPRVGGAAEQQAGEGLCRFHPKVPARWRCSKCGKTFCDLCVNSRSLPGGAKAYFCRPCGGECSPVAFRPTLKALDTGGFFSQLPTAFAYPFQKGRKYVLIGAIVAYIIMYLIKTYVPIPFGRWILTCLFFGYWYSFLQSIVHTTAYGDENEPTLPEPSNYRSDLVGPVFQMFATTAICFLPVVGLLIWKLFDLEAPVEVPILVLTPLCCLYYPMALLAMAIFDSVSGVNPMVVFPAIVKMPFQYLVTCVFMGLAIGGYYMGEFLLPLVIPIPVVPVAISSSIWLYLMMVMARTLGLLYYDNREQLGWLHHRH
jgi:hypothetical protein